MSVTQPALHKANVQETEFKVKKYKYGNLGADLILQLSSELWGK